MKTFIAYMLAAMLVGITPALTATTNKEITNVDGAYTITNGSTTQLLLIYDGYFSHTTYDVTAKQFIQTNGGAFSTNGNMAILTIEFDTRQPGRIGQKKAIRFASGKNQLVLPLNDNKEQWLKLPTIDVKLVGTWKITGRQQGNELVKIHQVGPRKTLKMLTGNRFQWFAINPETREFFGTGGGRYTFENGKYTEHIEFFSRDSMRVGASLSFDGKIVDGNWHHSGKSSKGDEIYEVWSRINRLP